MRFVSRFSRRLRGAGSVVGLSTLATAILLYTLLGISARASEQASPPAVAAICQEVTATPSPTRTRTSTRTPTNTRTATPLGTGQATRTPSKTSTASQTPTRTGSPIPSPTSAPPAAATAVHPGAGDNLMVRRPHFNVCFTARATHYEFQVSATNTFAQLEATGMISAAPVDDFSHGISHWQSSNALANGPHYWRVRGLNWTSASTSVSYVPGGWSTTIQFTIDPLAPAAEPDWLWPLNTSTPYHIAGVFMEPYHSTTVNAFPHQGLDLAGAALGGQDVLAARAGVLQLITNDPLGYNRIRLYHPRASGDPGTRSHMVTEYFHGRIADNIALPAGTFVNQGVRLTTVGNTSNSAMPVHLHFVVASSNGYVEDRSLPYYYNPLRIPTYHTLFLQHRGTNLMPPADVTPPEIRAVYLRGSAPNGKTPPALFAGGEETPLTSQIAGPVSFVVQMLDRNLAGSTTTSPYSATLSIKTIINNSSGGSSALTGTHKLFKSYLFGELNTNDASQREGNFFSYLRYPPAVSATYYDGLAASSAGYYLVQFKWTPPERSVDGRYEFAVSMGDAFGNHSDNGAETGSQPYTLTLGLDVTASTSRLEVDLCQTTPQTVTFRVENLNDRLFNTGTSAIQQTAITTESYTLSEYRGTQELTHTLRIVNNGAAISPTMVFDASSPPGIYRLRATSGLISGLYAEDSVEVLAPRPCSAPPPIGQVTTPNAGLTASSASNGLFTLAALSDPQTGGATTQTLAITTGWSERSPGNSRTTLLIDGQRYTYGDPSGTLVTPAQNSDRRTTASTWRIGDIEVSQQLELARDDQVLIRYVVRNAGSRDHSAGLRFMLDVEDRSRFAYVLPGEGTISQERAFASVPPQLSLVPAQRQDGLRLTIFQPAPDWAPDRLMIANWSGLTQRYEQAPQARALEDSAYALYWDPDTLRPGETRTYLTALRLERGPAGG